MIHKILEWFIRYTIEVFEILKSQKISISLEMSPKTSELTVMHLKPFKSRLYIPADFISSI